MLFPVLSGQLVLNAFLQRPVFHKIVFPLFPLLLLSQSLYRERNTDSYPLRQVRILTVDCKLAGGADQLLDDCREGAMPHTAVLGAEGWLGLCGCITLLGSFTSPPDASLLGGS